MPILLWILLLPILEIVGFILVGDWIGAGPTILLLVLSAVLGTMLVRRQGLTSLARAQGSLERGEAPGEAIFGGFCTVAAGILLIVPGFLTDLVGLILLIPPVRRGLGLWLLSRLAGNGAFQVWSSASQPGPGMGAGMGTGAGAGGYSSRGPDPYRTPPGVIDGDYRDVTEDAAAPGTPGLSDSRWGGNRPGKE